MPLPIVESKERGNEDLSSLERYFNILKGTEKANFVILKEQNLFDRKIEQARKELKRCMLCERNCGVNRIKGEKGYCELSDKMSVSSYFEHLGEEYFFVPSFLVLFWSCNFNCQYCENYTVSQRREVPSTISPKALARLIEKASRSQNVNFSGGEPTLQIPAILETLNSVNKNIPIVFNSNFYMTVRAMRLLDGVVDIWLSDLKYGNDRCAKRLSKIGDYTSIVTRNLLLASKIKNTSIIIRHLLLPGHLDCCTKPILKWIAENLPKETIINLMNQYIPTYNAADYREINTYPKKEDFERAVSYAKELGLNVMY